MKTLVTGASGNVGSEVLRRLVGKGASVRAMSRNPSLVSGQYAETIEWVEGDLGNPASLLAAVQGVDTVVLISPASPDLVARETAVIDAAKASGVRRIVKLSGLGAGPDAPIRLPQAHYAVEQYIAQAGFTYTFVRPNLFFQTLLGAVGSIASDGAIYAPAADGQISFTDTRDIADVIVAAATQPGHEGKAYELTGPAAHTYAQAAAALQVVIGKPVHHVDVSPDDARKAMLASGLDAWTAEAFIELYAIYRAGYGASVIDKTVQQVTGRQARGLSDFTRDYREQFLEA